jgi:hypothetical protein
MGLKKPTWPISLPPTSSGETASIATGARE